MINFEKDFDFFWDLINKNENFAFARYADGEVLLMKGLQVSENTQAFNIDRWKSPNTLTRVGKELLESLNHEEENYYYAISGKNDNLSDYDFLVNNIKQNKDKLTFVNLWINANYKRTKINYSQLKREVVLICNQKARTENFPFPVKEIIPFPDDCITFWESNSDLFINNLIEKVSKLENELFFISCGPVSEIIISNLYKKNPNNTYVDVGSSIDEFVHKRITRPYMIPNSIYSKQISTF